MRFDKYDGVTGGFRATAHADCPENEFGVALGASLNAAGNMLTRAVGNTGFVGLVIRDRTKRRAGDRQDIMTHGEIVLDSTEDQLEPGSNYYLDADGDLTTVAPGAGVAGYFVGRTVEAWRLVVRFQQIVGV